MVAEQSGVKDGPSGSELNDEGEQEKAGVETSVCETRDELSKNSLGSN